MWELSRVLVPFFFLSCSVFQSGRGCIGRVVTSVVLLNCSQAVKVEKEGGGGVGGGSMMMAGSRTSRGSRMSTSSSHALDSSDFFTGEQEGGREGEGRERKTGGWAKREGGGRGEKTRLSVTDRETELSKRSQ